ncbi:MFS transporter [Brevibacillus massiliensis]|uniref:MFS transporter n=1 Tax=Brevibacillus massiliensis TaxID=1118054 RepID=UPI0002EA5F38|nr:MFS transporter [Brevibacillus massiliensis]
MPDRWPVVAAACFAPVSKALMSDLTPPEKRFRLFSLRYWSGNVGFAVGPLVGGFLGLSGSPLPFVMTGVAYLLFTCVVYRLAAGIDEPTGAEAEPLERLTLPWAWKTVRGDRVLLLFILGGVLTMTVHGQMSVTLSQYVKANFHDGIKLFAVLMSVNSLAVILLQYPLSKWAEGRSYLLSICWGSVLFAAGEMGFALSQSAAWLIVSMVVFTLGEILVVPAEYIMLDEIAPEGMRGTYYGAQTFAELGNFLGPWLGGLILAAYGGSAMFLAMGAVALAAILFYWQGQQMYLRRQQRKPAAV